MADPFPNRESVMRHAIELAYCGQGYVEPNPLVGAVVVDESLNPIAEGYHQEYGGPHAEIHALAMAGNRARGATLYVTLEPCCHFGKTGPCTAAIIEAGVRRVVVGLVDPSAHGNGKGIATLRAAGIDVEVGFLQAEIATLTAPFTKRVTTGLPFVVAKWAMTLDGKLASHRGDSRWISNAAAREIAHRLRGRMDAVIVGAGTVQADNPLLTARPPGPRLASRVVVDREASLSLLSQLVRTVSEAPVLLAASDRAPAANVRQLKKAGVQVLTLPGSGRHLDLTALLRELGKRDMTNVLVEGGGRLLGTFFDNQLVDEVHVFVAPAVAGGQKAITPVAGNGIADVARFLQLDRPKIEIIGDNAYIHGAVKSTSL